MMLEMLALVAFAGLLVYAACTDVASLTIPNWVSIALAVLFIPIVEHLKFHILESHIQLLCKSSICPSEAQSEVVFGRDVDRQKSYIQRKLGSRDAS